MKIMIEVNLELGLQEYPWQQPDNATSENAWHPACAVLTEDHEPAQTGFIADSKKRLH